MQQLSLQIGSQNTATMHSVLSRTICRPIFDAKSLEKRKIVLTRAGDRLSGAPEGARDENTLRPIPIAAANPELDHHKLELLARKSLGWLAQPPVPLLPIFESESSQVRTAGRMDGSSRSNISRDIM